MSGLKNKMFILCLLFAMQDMAHGQSGVARGEMLYQRLCNSCHSTEIHWRNQKRVTDWNSLKAQVRRWQDNIGLAWSAEEISDVAQYLNEHYYGFPVPDRRVLLKSKYSGHRQAMD